MRKADEKTEVPVERPYCRFGKRDLEKMSWIAPLVNNRFGDALNIELRHQQLFFIDGDTVTDNIGYSEKGTRFNEADFGKPIKTLEEMTAAGYWLVGRAFDPQVMREALSRQKDGYYYSIFSNQCQDWADRLQKTAQRVEKEWGLKAGEILDGLPPEQKLELKEVKRVPPTEPASLSMGVIATFIGLAAIAAPYFFASKLGLLLGAFFLASGVSHLVYAFRGKDMRAAVPIVITAFVYLLGGAFLLLNRVYAIATLTLVIALVLGFQGLTHIFMAAFSRPIKNWMATLATGIVNLLLAHMIFYRWPISGQKFMGIAVGISLIIGGLSTIYLSQKTRNDVG
ncbi:DUF308 domain-containing protein [Arenicella sp.]|nr:DUF308 domain-containing protein [Arenicella sp.]